MPSSTKRRKGLIGRVCLDLGVNIVVIQVLALEDEGLAHEVIGRVVEVLGGEGGLVDGRKGEALP